MASKYQENERERATRLLAEKNGVFYGGSAGGYYRGSNRDFVLSDCKKNLYRPIKDEVIEYFKCNGISWWGGKTPTGHVLSSQISCLNHLFPIRKDKQAVLSLLKSFSDDFTDVYEISTDTHNPAYIQFESVSDHDYLNEGQSTRGSNCTSIDALIFAKHKNGQKWLIPIEWKYTEHYDNTDKSTEDSDSKSHNHEGKKRLNRLDRYSELIHDSARLKHLPDYRSSVYFFEPFYQLMRQTLWAEQMLKNKNAETLKADNYFHLHIISEQNEDLLQKKYKCSGLGMEPTWRNYLTDDAKYKIISPKSFLQNIDKQKYMDLVNYLETRYWAS